MNIDRPVVLAILDGWGIGRPGSGNAITLAHTPNMTSWWKTYPHSQLVARGTAVGLPGTTTGNSEVGHMNLGGGYIVPQDLERINQSVDDKSFFANQAIVSACQTARERGSQVHILGLVGPGMVHSSLEHLWAVLQLVRHQGIDLSYVHIFSDGRDSSPSWMGKNAEAIEGRVRQQGGQVASLCGRYFAMDRDQRWERTKKAYDLLTKRAGKHAAHLATAAKNSYQQQVSDEFIEPTVVGNGRAIQENDVVIFVNFRTDRPRQLCQALVMHDFSGFDRDAQPKNLYLCTMTQYQEGLAVQAVAFPPFTVEYPLARVVSEAGLRQLHVSETEKYAHVTYFFNGGREEPFAGEDRIHIPSAKVATYDLAPSMSADGITETVVRALEQNVYDFILVNYANTDMVAHTGNLDATIEAVEVVDRCIGTVWQAVSACNGIMLVTADHGNAEVLTNPVSGEMDTEHNPSDVPLIALGEQLPGKLKPSGVLSNVSPTLIPLLGLSQPPAMTAESLWT